MTAFVLKPLGFAVITLFAVLTIVFFIVRILPGDPAIAILGDQASQEALIALRQQMGHLASRSRRSPMTKDTISETAALKALLSETADHQILAEMLGFVPWLAGQ